MVHRVIGIVVIDGRNRGILDVFLLLQLGTEIVNGVKIHAQIFNRHLTLRLYHTCKCNLLCRVDFT